MTKSNIKKSVPPPITLETTLSNAKKWLNIIRYGESGTVIQIQDDCEYRVLEIINNPAILKSVLGLYHRKYLLRYVPIDQKDLQNAIKDTLVEVCVERKIATRGILSEMANYELLKEIAEKGYDVGLFLTHIKPLLNKNNFQPLIDLELLIRTSKNLSVVVFSEIDITHGKYNLLVDKCSFLYDHIIKYPLYDESDSRQFIIHHNHQWNFSLPEKTINEIIRSCGGYLWLIHQAHRNLRDNPEMTINQALTDGLLIKKLEIVWNKFTKDEQSIFRKIVLDTLQEKDTLTHEFHYLKSIRAILEDKEKVTIGIPLLTTIIEQENKLNKFKVRENNLFIGNIDITMKLTKKERILMLLLLSTKKRVISRDTAAKAIWGKDWEEKYSDWAIDRLVHRVRKKLKSLGIDEKLLKTVKKKGFIFG